MRLHRRKTFGELHAPYSRRGLRRLWPARCTCGKVGCLEMARMERARRRLEWVMINRALTGLPGAQDWERLAK